MTHQNREHVLDVPESLRAVGRSAAYDQHTSFSKLLSAIVREYAADQPDDSVIEEAQERTVQIKYRIDDDTFARARAKARSEKDTLPNVIRRELRKLG